MSVQRVLMNEGKGPSISQQLATDQVRVNSEAIPRKSLVQGKKKMSQYLSIGLQIRLVSIEDIEVNLWLGTHWCNKKKDVSVSQYWTTDQVSVNRRYCSEPMSENPLVQ